MENRNYFLMNDVTISCLLSLIFSNKKIDSILTKINNDSNKKSLQII
jgi:hypothetical protein